MKYMILYMCVWEYGGDAEVRRQFNIEVR